MDHFGASRYRYIYREHRGAHDCPNLTSITFVNCGNPFKKDGKALFRTREFTNLDIGYS